MDNALPPVADSYSCHIEARPMPCALVIFGGSGDLAARKLLPALSRLFDVAHLPERFAILAAARTDLNSETFRARIRQALVAAGRFNPGRWELFAPHLHYQRLDYDAPSDYRRLAESLAALEAASGLSGARIFHLAVPPALYEAAASNLGQAGLARSPDPNGYARVVIEKPFGRDLASARSLDTALRAWFSEEQIFRIDHYLAKESFQNLTLFRFANAVFEPVWNRNYIRSVSVVSAESLGVERRAGYYEQTGVLRDMFQNHMMQLLALGAMEPPPRFEAELTRDEKSKVYRSLRPFDRAAAFTDLALGQYAAGEIDGKPLPAYRDEPGVALRSLTPTFAMLRVFIDNWRWQGVPFYLASGKRLRRKVTRIAVQFKEAPQSVFRNLLGEHITANRLIMEAHPEQSISMALQVKEPGGRLCLRSAAMRFDFAAPGAGPALDSYEKSLLDCMQGDQTLFLRQDAEELCWEFLTPILDMCEACDDLAARLRPYPSGSWGPPEALALHPGYLQDVGP